MVYHMAFLLTAANSTGNSCTNLIRCDVGLDRWPFLFFTLPEDGKRVPIFPFRLHQAYLHSYI